MVLYWAIGYAQMLPARRSIHKVLGYISLALWFVFGAPTSVYLLIYDPNRTGPYWLQLAVVLNLAETIWAVSEFMYMGIARIRARPLVPTDISMHRRYMTLALIASHFILLTRFLHYLIVLLGLRDYIGGAREIYTLTVGPLVFPALLAVTAHEVCVCKRRKPAPVLLRWSLLAALAYSIQNTK